MNDLIRQKTWSEFRETGLFMFVNCFLHIFGWAIVIEYDAKGNISEVYPARVKFRGFSERSQHVNYKKIAEYMLENADILMKETEENDDEYGND